MSLSKKEAVSNNSKPLDYVNKKPKTNDLKEKSQIPIKVQEQAPDLKSVEKKEQEEKVAKEEKRNLVITEGFLQKNSFSGKKF